MIDDQELAAGFGWFEPQAESLYRGHDVGERIVRGRGRIAGAVSVVERKKIADWQIQMDIERSRDFGSVDDVAIRRDRKLHAKAGQRGT